jgi:excisionase family DNA binding protein
MSKGNLDKPLLATIQKTEAILSIGHTKTYELINSGQLKTVRIGRRRLVTMESIEALAAVG